MEKVTKQITVVLGCVIRDGKVLMTLRKEEEMPAAHMKWELPGGKIDFGETAEQSIEREFLEETGVKIKAQKLLSYIHVSYWDYPWGKQQTVLLCYVCEFIEEKIRPKDHHVEDIAWIPVKDVVNLETLPGVKEFIHLSVDQ